MILMILWSKRTCPEGTSYKNDGLRPSVKDERMIQNHEVAKYKINVWNQKNGAKAKIANSFYPSHKWDGNKYTL